MSNLSTLPKGDSAWLLRKAIERIIQQVSVLETNIGASTSGNSLDGQIIFNDNGTLRGDTGLTYEKAVTTLRTGRLIVLGDTQLATVGTLYVGTTVNPRLKVDVGANLTTITNATITGDLTVATNKLAVTGGNVGIGTATPTNYANYTTLTINGTNGGEIDLTDGGTLRGQLFSDSTGLTLAAVGGLIKFGAGTGGLEKMRLDSAGNLGIGVTPSAWYSDFKALQIASSGSYLTSQISGATINQWLYIGNNAFYDSVDSRWEYIRSKPSAQYIQYNNEHQWLRDTGTQTAGAACSFTQAMTLDASGNLLVASGVVRAAGRTQIGAGYIADIAGTGNSRGIFFSSNGLLPTDGSGNPSDNTYDLGEAAYRWDTVFAGTGTINTSDRNEKQDISDLSASEKRVASSIKQLVKKYRFKDAVASKDENARIHVGWIAQDIQSAFAAEGLDASNYGMFCSDTWEENGVEKTRLGLRYDEVLAFVVSTI